MASSLALRLALKWAVPAGTAGNKYTYSEKPIDEPDALARSHDITYENAGVTSWWGDTKGLDADRRFVQGLQEYINNASQNGYKDTVTKKSPSKEALSSAKNAIILFNKAIKNKEKKLNESSD